jgi:hypothetical protein
MRNDDSSIVVDWQVAKAAFASYCEAVSERLPHSSGSARVVEIPPTPPKLAQHGEALPEFVALHDVLGAEPPYYGEPSGLGLVLRRSGTYSRLLKGETAASIWESVEPHLRERTATVRRLVSLAGWEFASDSVEVAGYKIRKLKQKDRCPYEEAGIDYGGLPGLSRAIEESWLADAWFLEQKVERPVFDLSPTGGGPGPSLSEFCHPLLLLSLFRPEPFWTGATIEMERGWSLDYLGENLRLPPLAQTGPGRDDVVIGATCHFTSEAVALLQEFFHVLEPSLVTVEKEGVNVAALAGTYLSGREACGFSGNGWPADLSSAESAFLKTIVFVETHLLPKPQKGMPAVDSFGNAVARLLTDAHGDLAQELYRRRNRIVHERSSPEAWPNVQAAFDLSRKCLACWIHSRSKFASYDQWQRALRGWGQETRLRDTWDELKRYLEPPGSLFIRSLI